MQLKTSELHEIKYRIREWAIGEGFLQVGFTCPEKEDMEHLERKFRAWVKNGYHAKMNWFTNTLEKRINVKKYFPEARSIVVFMTSYYHEESNEHKDAPYKIARYAHGKDYHKVLKKKLQKLIKELLAGIEGIQYRITVDSSPMAERYWAQKAGLGWIGKNTMLISPKFGSYTFLATLITNLPFSPDPPFEKDLCGTCERCLRSCPTKAILPKKIIDSNKCISYLTIEHRGSIEKQWLEKLNGWIFGCDICQEVCPWNSRKVITSEKRFWDQYNPAKIPSVLESEVHFHQFFAGTPIRRAGFKHFRYVVHAVQGIRDH
jgi:epoxyqueuosine reductase